MKALYCYWGRLGDHNLNIPGHPLYQAFFLKSLKKKFHLNKIDFFSFLKSEKERSLKDIEFFILEEKRRQILNSLNIEIINLSEVLNRIRNNFYDFIFLKARFRNKSRLEEKSYDALKFEKILSYAKDSKSEIYVIDSDGELPQDFFKRYPFIKVLTYFYYADLFYTFSDYEVFPKRAETIVPALSEDFYQEKKLFSRMKYDLFFIGNYGLKQPKLFEYLEQLSRDGLKVAVQGKWPNRFSFKIYQRYERKKAYEDFFDSISTIQISKPKYREFSFLSPRIYEAAACGLACFIESGYVCSTKFLEIDSYLDLREKLLCLREGYERDFYSIRDEFYQKLYEIEKKIMLK